MFLPTYDVATDRRRGPMSDMLLFAEHPFLPIHAALFSNFDGTYSAVVSGRNGQQCDGSYTISLAGVSRASIGAMEIVLRPASGGNAAERVTFEDTGNQITGIRFEVRSDRQPVV
jgi:hypothetical protein